jgi:hypothetical protein
MVHYKQYINCEDEKKKQLDLDPQIAEPDQYLAYGCTQGEFKICEFPFRKISQPRKPAP